MVGSSGVDLLQRLDLVLALFAQRRHAASLVVVVVVVVVVVDVVVAGVLDAD